jgi:transposase InsO family protein
MRWRAGALPYMPWLITHREEGLTVRMRKARRRAIGTRTPILVEAKVNARWSLDFVHDQLAQCRRFRILNIVDDVTRECLAAIPDTSISRKRVARELTVLIDARGKPGMIVSDNGTEFTSNAILGWANDHGVEWHYIAPGKPMQTATSNRSTAGSATSFSMRAYSWISIRPASSSAPGSPITTPRGRTPRSDTKRRRLMPVHLPRRGA